DSTGPDYVDLDKGTTNPKYASVTSGTYARPNPGAGNDYAILFDGDDDYLFTATTLNNPGVNMGSEGMQMWVYPRADNLGVTGQAIVFDTGNVGGPAISESGHWTQISFGHIDLATTVPVVANQWAHVAQHVYRHADALAPDLVPGSGNARTYTSVMYVNGVAVSANNDNDLGAETSGGFLIGAADAALPGAAVAPTAFFSGVIDELEVYTSAADEFDLFADNDWIAARIAQ